MGPLSLVLLAAVAAQTPASARGCLDIVHHLEKEGVAVAIGRVSKVTEGKRERMKDGEGKLGEAGQGISLSGTIFHRVSATANLLVTKPLAGLGGEKTLPLAFDLQSARLSDGSPRRHFLLEPRVLLEEGMLGLFVVQKGKGSWTVLEVVRFDPTALGGGDPEANFVKRSEDCVEVNRRVFTLKRALDEDDAAGEMGGKAERIAALRRAVERKVKMLLPEDDSLLTTRAGPCEKRVRERIAELEKDGED